MRSTLPVKKLLKMDPLSLSNVDPANFKYLRAKDIANFSEDQIMALTPQQIEVLKPIAFSEVNLDVLGELLSKLKNLPDDERSKAGNMSRGTLSAEEIIHKAIPKARKVLKEKEKWEHLRSQDGLITDTLIAADVVAAKLDITLRFLYMLATGEEDRSAEIIMTKIGGRLVCDKPSVIHYLNRQRQPGAHIDSKGKPIYHTRLNELGEREVLYNSVERGTKRPSFDPVPLEPLTDIPLLFETEKFAKILRMDQRTFVRNCNAGYYDHYRIGSTLKMSEDDFLRSIHRIQDAQTKKPRYSRAK